MFDVMSTLSRIFLAHYCNLFTKKRIFEKQTMEMTNHQSYGVNLQNYCKQTVNCLGVDVTMTHKQNISARVL